MYTSRSAVECYQDCNYKRFLQYHYQGVGIVSKKKNIPLVTGTCIHRGIEHLFNRVRIGQEPSVDTAVGLAVEVYEKECYATGFRGKGVDTDEQQLFTFAEQKALAEALIRAWALCELPNLIERYTVLNVERDIVPIEIAPDVWFQAKVDAELQEKDTKEYVNYSLKSARQWGEKEELGYKSDLQGVTEIWAVEEDSKLCFEHVNQIVRDCEMLDGHKHIPQDKLVQIAAWFSKQRKNPKSVSQTRFCILIKGTRKQPDYYGDKDALYITYNPLIRGYKKFTPGTVEFAHSWFYPNPDNKSGRSILGKGWEPFNVWESDISIKTWVEELASQRIQPECGDIVKAHVVTPVEYFRQGSEVELAIREVIEQEVRVRKGLKLLESAKSGGTPITVEQIMAEYFPHKRKQCYWDHGYVCEYLPACWDSTVVMDEIYEMRTPHHDAELRDRG